MVSRNITLIKVLFVQCIGSKNYRILCFLWNRALCQSRIKSWNYHGIILTWLRSITVLFGNRVNNQQSRPTWCPTTKWIDRSRGIQPLFWKRNSHCFGQWHQTLTNEPTKTRHVNSSSGRKAREKTNNNLFPFHPISLESGFRHGDF